METKKCPYCAEDIKKEAKVCKHCGKDILSIKEIEFEEKINKYEKWLQQNYPQYNITYKDYKNKSITINARYKDFSILILIILLLLGVILGILYAIIAGREKSATIQIYFYDTGRVKKVNNRVFSYLLTKYNKFEKLGNIEINKNKKNINKNFKLTDGEFSIKRVISYIFIGFMLMFTISFIIMGIQSGSILSLVAFFLIGLMFIPFVYKKLKESAKNNKKFEKIYNKFSLYYFLIGFFLFVIGGIFSNSGDFSTQNNGSDKKIVKNEIIEKVEEKKFGFTELERKNIFLELLNFEIKADKEAENKFPTYSKKGLNISNQEIINNVQKKIDLYDELRDKYNEEIYEKYIKNELYLIIDIII